jgi:hypothetical protein
MENSSHALKSIHHAPLVRYFWSRAVQDKCRTDVLHAEVLFRGCGITVARMVIARRDCRLLCSVSGISCILTVGQSHVTLLSASMQVTQANEIDLVEIFFISTTKLPRCFK